MSNAAITTGKSPDQAQVAGWFNKTYSTKAFGYLRPVEAYPIYMQLLKAKPGEKLLDVACGPGVLLKASVRSGVKPHGIDISDVAIDMAKEFVPEADVQVGNAESLPFADGTFDLLTCIGSLERMFDREQVLSEMRRVTKPGARLCLMLRNADAIGWRFWRKLLRRQNHAGHQDAKSMEQWQVLLEQAGFKVEEILMDQWGRQRLRRWLFRFGRHPAPGAKEPVARPLTSMRNAYEHIFILSR